MKKVYQTIISRLHGNCMQAVIASLLELELDQVPHFKDEESWFSTMFNFLKKHGYIIRGELTNKADGLIHQTVNSNYVDRFPDVKNMEGIGGFFYAGVHSPLYYRPNDKPITDHAVVIDRYFNIVHDPNPWNEDVKKYPLADLIGYNGVVDVILIEPIDKSDQ